MRTHFFKIVVGSVGVIGVVAATVAFTSIYYRLHHGTSRSEAAARQTVASLIGMTAPPADLEILLHYEFQHDRQTMPGEWLIRSTTVIVPVPQGPAKPARGPRAFDGAILNVSERTGISASNMNNPKILEWSSGDLDITTLSFAYNHKHYLYIRRLRQFHY